MTEPNNSLGQEFIQVNIDCGIWRNSFHCSFIFYFFERSRKKPVSKCLSKQLYKCQHGNADRIYIRSFNYYYADNALAGM